LKEERNKMTSRVFATVFLAIWTFFVVSSTSVAQKATTPYHLSVFAKAPAGLSAPDSVAVLGDRVFIGYGDNHLPDGSDGLNSQVVEYKMNGSIVHVYTVHGHNDGVKIDPITHKVWALQNEDANPNLVIIDPKSQQQKEFTFGPTPHGGGYDDLVFRGCDVFISASNPAHNPNTGPAIVEVRLEGDMAEVSPVLAGTANAIGITSGKSIKLNLQDPDSMTLDPFGDLVLDSQADQELIIVTNPDTSEQQAIKVPLSFRTGHGLQSVETDDTNFATSSQGFILFADKVLNTVFVLQTKVFAPGEAYTAADGGPFVGTVNLSTGIVTPVVTGLGDPGGLVFVDTSGHRVDNGGAVVESHQRDGRACRDRDSW
jgi:hypothetical protein